MQILKDSDLINLWSTIYQVLNSKDEDFQISIVCFLVIKFFALILAEVDVLNVNI